ncbi:MAG: ribokinase, partial [Chloroflexi bacterium]|nr:ribokinase [Chloroflexota bacterium]
PAAAAGLLLPCGLTAVVVTLGAQGSVLVSPGVEIDIPAFAVEAVDRTGAGDAFVGNLAHALDDGQDLEAAVRFASAAAACSVQVAGGLPSMPTLEQTRRLLAEVAP